MRVTDTPTHDVDAGRLQPHPGSGRLLLSRGARFAFGPRPEMLYRCSRNDQHKFGVGIGRSQPSERLDELGDSDI